MGTVGLAGRSGAALAAALVLALALASPSFAAKKWIFWGAEQSQVINCPSQIAGVPYSEVGARPARSHSWTGDGRPRWARSSTCGPGRGRSGGPAWTSRR